MMVSKSDKAEIGGDVIASGIGLAGGRYEGGDGDHGR